ncbi:NAD(P)(+) transhydrogenase (Re/Si-specific) subunit alpha, partial [Klebsiella pneumoniae]
HGGWVSFLSFIAVLIASINIFGGFTVTQRMLKMPLMSVTNAISGIIVVGALLQIGHGGWVSFLSFIAVLIASINIFGGFTVTQRMLKM